MLQKKNFKRDVHKTCVGQYLLYSPRSVAPKRSQRWPLIFFLHGMGERGDNLDLVKKHGPMNYDAAQPDFGFFIVAPQCPMGHWWRNEDLLPLLDHALEEYPVDTDRVYVTGLSMGGFGTWHLALEYPERFAAAIPICGGGNPYVPHSYDAEKARALRALPFWVFHGALDKIIPCAESERMVKGLQVLGCQVKFTIYPEAAHDAWTETYNNPKLYEWLKQQRRGVI